MTNSAWKTPHFFACYAERSAETGKCSPTFVWLLPGIFDLLSVSVFRKNNILDSSKKRGESDRSGRSRSLYKISKKINCNVKSPKCSTFEMIFLTQRHRSRAISEKCNKILHKIILSLSLWAINASPFGERQLSERRQSYEWNVEA